MVATATVVSGSGNTQYLVTFSGAAGTHDGGILNNGVYTLSTDATKIHAISGGAQLTSQPDQIFWALYATVDANNTISGSLGDGNSELFVDNGDFGLFKDAYGSETDDPGLILAYNPAFDFNLDGFVDNGDYGALKDAYGADWTF